MRNKELKICFEYDVETKMGGYWSKETQENKPLVEEPTKTSENKSVEQEKPQVEKPKAEESKVEESKKEVKHEENTGDKKTSEVSSQTPNSTPSLSGDKEKTVDPVFKEVIQETGTKIGVRPVDVSPSADVVKKGKKKNKNKE